MRDVAATLVALLLLAPPAAGPHAWGAEEAPGRDPGAILAEADEAYAAEDYKRARPLYEEAARLDPRSVRALRRAALLQSWDGDLQASIGNYRAARALAPDDLDISLELAKVLSWGNNLGASIAVYEELRGRHPDEPRVLLGLGEVLSWKGRFADADALYRDMVDRQIAPIKAHLGRALIRGWQGDFDAAADFYRDVLKAEPGNLEARLGLARVHHWEGLDRVAREQVGNIVMDHPDSRDARELQETIDLTLRPRGEIDAFRFSDSDSNRVDAATAGTVFMAEPQTSIRIDYSNLRAEWRCQVAAFCAAPGLGVGEVAGARSQVVTAGLTSRLIKPLTFHMRVGAVRQDTFTGTSRAVGIGGGFIRWQFGPRFGLVTSGGRETLLDTALLMDRGIRVDNADVRLEYRFHPGWTLSGGGGYGSYSDGNFRQSAGAFVQYRFPVSNPSLSLMLDVRYRTFHQDLDSGYFDPRRYDSELLTLALWDEYRQGRFFWRIEGTWGRQDFETGAGVTVESGSDDTVQAAYVSAGVGFGKRGSLEAFYARSDYALQLATGFTSSRSGFAFRYRF
ncbi:MAG: tetratricopeptide repeat protein [Candidatus Polarisedimenticolia bacterium]